MTREQALKVNQLLYRIESLENLIDELEHLDSLAEYYGDFNDHNLQDEIVSVVQARLNKTLKELEEL